jgi:hypothetical protein
VRYTIQRMLTCLALAGFFLLQLNLGHSRSAGIEPLRHDEILAQCVDRVEKWFKLITIRSQELDLDHARIVLVGPTVHIPLKTAHEHVKAIWWRSEDVTQAISAIRFLREGKIGAVGVLPFAQDPANLYEMRAHLLDELKGCEQKEQVRAVLGQCSECNVREWLDIKP